MKEYMYTYHYFRRRTMQRPFPLADLVFHLILLSSTVFMAKLYFGS